MRSQSEQLVPFMGCRPPLDITGRSPVDEVDPNIGGIGRLLKATSPAVYLPYGMVSVAPVTPPHITDRYLADTIIGFPTGGTHVMPISGDVPPDPSAAASTYDHDLETATPYYYAVLLESYDIQAELTVSHRAVFYQFHFPPQRAAHLLWHHGREGQISLRGNCVEGEQTVRGGAKIWFSAELSQPISATCGCSGSAGAATCVTLAATDKPVQLRVGVSHISLQQARINRDRELPNWDFAAACRRTRDAWERTFAQVQVTGGSAQQRRIFYTSLYRAHQRMNDITEDGQYRGFDGQVHQAGDHPYYTNDWIWDTYRCMHPLQLLLDPQRQEHMIQSYVRMYEQSGWLPRFPGLCEDAAGMIGHHTAALVADTWFKGHRNFDIRKAYEGIRKNLMEAMRLPFKKGPATSLDRFYLEHGYFPALARGEVETVAEVHSFERRQAVSVTLEAAYDDWCLARLARELGNQADFEIFSRRALNYRNVFNPEIGFMAPRSADGKWVEDYDPKYGGGQGARDYFAECNGWTYTWHVQHDVAGLIALMGGREKFVEKLDALFVEQYDPKDKYHFLGQFPDCTALIGQFCQGNEPSFHIPYLYCYAGAPWKTQKRVRQAMATFHDGPEGVPGDEDGGAMSSWYVMSAIGIYPVCPGMPYYVIGSPIFEQTRITRVDGKTFTITAKDVSAANKYIQSATLNGKPLDRPWFWHEELIDGGELVLQMGPRPNKSWGSAPEAAPPSLMF